MKLLNFWNQSQYEEAMLTDVAVWKDALTVLTLLQKFSDYYIFLFIC